MKMRRFIALILILGMLAGSFGTVVNAEYDTASDYVLADFSDAAELSKWTPYSTYSHIPTLVTETPEFAGYGSMGKYSILNDGNTNIARVTKSFKNNGMKTDWSEYKSLNMWVYSPAATGAKTAVVLGSSKDEATGKNGYYVVYISFDWVGWRLLSFNIGIDGVSGNYTRTWSVIESLQFQSTAYACINVVGTVLYIDKIWLSTTYTDSLALQSVTPVSGSDNVTVDNTTVSFNFNAPIYPGEQAVDVKVSESADGEQFSPVDSSKYTTSFADSSFCVDFNNYFSNIMTYKVEITNIFGRCGGMITNPMSTVFKTSAEEFLIRTPALNVTELPAHGAIQATASVYNIGSSPVGIRLVLAVYDEKNRMVAYDYDDKIVEQEDNLPLQAEVDRASYENCTVKTFLLNTTSLMRPVRDIYAGLGNIQPPKALVGGDVGMIAMNEVNAVADTVTLNGTISPAAERSVSIIVADKEGNIVHCVQTASNAEGEVSYSFALDSDIDPEGDYSVSVSAAGTNNTLPDIKSFYFANSEIRRKVREEINAPSANVGQIMNSYIRVLGVENKDYTLEANSNVTKTIFEQRPYNTFEEILNVYYKTAEALAAVNAGSWSNMAEVFVPYEKLLFNNNADYLWYRDTLSSEQKIAVNRMFYVSFPISDFAKLRTVFSNAVSSYKQQLNSGDNGSGGGSGGSIGGGSAAVIARGDKTQATPPPATAAPNQTGISSVFTDLESAAWARESIEKLYETGALAKSENGLFRPNDNVTRGEFIKMLVTGLDMSAEGAKCSFADVNKTAWYYVAAAAAQKNEIVLGDANGNLDAEKAISRQDMAVMVYRAARKSGFEAENDAEVSFEDNDDIEAYAKDAIAVLQQAGILSGMGNNRFEPNGIVSRAQAAQVIYNLMCYLKIM